MRTWLMAALVFLTPGGGIYLAYRALRRLAQRQADPRLSTAKPIYRYTTFDPALRDRTAARRKAAATIRSRANAVESGTKTPDLLRRVK